MRPLGLLSFAIASLLASAALAAPVKLTDTQLNSVTAGTDFTVVKLISDQPGVAPTTDPMLVNAWGLSAAPGGPLWVANNGTGTSTVYDPSSFSKLGLTVYIPSASGAGWGPVTGTVFNGGPSQTFNVTEAGKTGESVFLFDSEDGLITGWAPSVDFHNAVIAVNDSAQGAIFKGLALVPIQHTQELFAADFGNNRVDIFNTSFQQVGAFTDHSLPAGYAPFDVQSLNGMVYVTFAKHADPLDEVDAHGVGYVDLFNNHGQFVRRLVAGGPLNAPWGMTIAPASFGQFAGALLVGNFGDGYIDAFDSSTGAYLGQLKQNGKPITIDGLWSLTQWSDGEILFSAGPGGENHGLVGAIRPATAAASWAFRAHATH